MIAFLQPKNTREKRNLFGMSVYAISWLKRYPAAAVKKFAVLEDLNASQKSLLGSFINPRGFYTLSKHILIL